MALGRNQFWNWSVWILKSVNEKPKQLFLGTKRNTKNKKKVIDIQSFSSDHSFIGLSNMYPKIERFISLTFTASGKRQK